MTKKMPQKCSAGLLMFRRRNGEIEVFLGHPGGPFFRRKDEGHWSIPKGEIDPGEQPEDAAVREFYEETGIEAAGRLLPLGGIKQKGGKTVCAWAFEGDYTGGWDMEVCTKFNIEWPPKSGRRQDFPELDQARFFSIEEARKKLKDTQHPFLDRLLEHIGRNG